MLWLGRSHNEVSWEPSAALPKHLIEKYEQGITSTEPALVSEVSYGVVSSTIVVNHDSHSSSDEPKKKKQKKDRIIMEEFEGWAISILSPMVHLYTDPMLMMRANYCHAILKKIKEQD